MTASKTDSIASSVNAIWEKSALSALKKFTEIPNLSPAFDPQWDSNGLLDRAAALLVSWIKKQPIGRLQVEVVKHEGRTPVILAEIDGESEETILLYGHLDKQPPGTGWDEGLGPYKPVVRKGKLYGRGVADDGYALFSVIAAIRAVQETGNGHARVVVLIDASEESNSRDLPYYLEILERRVGSPKLVVCLDSVAAEYNRLWVTTSLRGSVVGTLRVSLLREGVHSGSASGIVPSSFRVARQLLDRLEDPDSGEIVPTVFHVDIPEIRRKEAAQLAEVLGSGIWEGFRWQNGAKPVTSDPEELILNRTWRPALAVTGQAGIPPIEQAGNVLRPFTALKLSLRIPPLCDPDDAARNMKRLLEKDPPYGADISFEISGKGPGWNAPEQAAWLPESLDRASTRYYGKPAGYIGVGGGIPLLNLLERRFPDSQFLVTGMLGPDSNPHGPNESLDLDGVKKLTACIARVIVDHFNAGPDMNV